MSGARTPLAAQEPQSVVLPTYVADVDGSGSLDSVDERLVRNAFYSQRGFGLSPVPGFDLRADVFGRGSVDVTAVDAVRTTLEAQVTGSVHADQRPITVAWHYGWYNNRTREPGMHTVQFKEGDYSSRDVDVETLFNDQKNEFGITVDALSWIPVRSNNNIVDNYRLGLLSTPNLHTRYLSLLYESTLALPLGRDRIDFLDASVSALLQEDFDQMGRFLANARDGAGARVFTLDGRPVVFIFGSHTWGLLPLESAQFTAFEVALDRAREAFRVRYGSLPFLVGEEKILSAGGVFADDRVRHMASFDAAYVYHHASLKPLSVAPGLGGTFGITPRYVEHQIAILQHNFRAVQDIRSRYTGNRVLLIPNLSPGFAKPGLPTLTMGRGEYADFMKTMRAAHLDLLAQNPWPGIVGTTLLPAPVYIVGSWNEEFEGRPFYGSTVLHYNSVADPCKSLWPTT